MKRIYNNYFLVGLFTIVIGVTTIFLLLIMGGKNNSAESYYSYFANVTGLGYGNPVYYEGYRVGQVENITPETKDGQLLFKTEYTLIAGWQIPTDSITKITSSGLLSDMSLNISAGKATSFIAPNSEIKGEIGDDIMATVTKLAGDFDRLNEEKITPLFDMIYERVDKITKPLEIQIPEILTSIEVLIKDTNKLVLSADKLVGEDNIAGINNIITNLEDLSVQLSSAGGWLKTSIDNANQLIDNSDNKIATVLDITIKMMDALSVKADTISSEIESASMNINEATEIIRKNPANLIFKNKSKIADKDL